jgi:MFS family permease
MFALVDRQILVLLAEPIRKHLALSDLQRGLLQGAGIAIFAALATYPLGWLADRFDTRLVLKGCIAAWSTAVAACGLAQTF